jgi:hypothetical protein
MEPQIIDYYNEIPHGINVIDKMNDELEGLHKKYDALKEKYDELESRDKMPKIIFDSIEGRNKKHIPMLNNIKEICNQWVDQHYEDRFGFFYDWGFGAIQMITRPDVIGCINVELNKIIKNEYWSHKLSHEIIRGLSEGLRGREMPHWNKIYNSLTKDDIKEILYDHIEIYIYDHMYSEYIYNNDDY